MGQRITTVPAHLLDALEGAKERFELLKENFSLKWGDNYTSSLPGMSRSIKIGQPLFSAKEEAAMKVGSGEEDIARAQRAIDRYKTIKKIQAYISTNKISREQLVEAVDGLILDPDYEEDHYGEYD